MPNISGLRHIFDSYTLHITHYIKDSAPALYTDLEAAIAAVPTNEDEITTEHYNALKAAYDAFMAKYVKPAALRTALATARDNAATYVVGTQPGFWAEGGADALNAAIATATAYDQGGVYDAAKSEELIAGLETEGTNFFASANQINPGKWDYFHMPSEEMYAENQWPTSNMVDENSGLGSLYGQYVTAGTIEQPEGDGND